MADKQEKVNCNAENDFQGLMDLYKEWAPKYDEVRLIVLNGYSTTLAAFRK